MEQFFPSSRVELQVGRADGWSVAALRALPIVTRVEAVQSRATGAPAFLSSPPATATSASELFHLAASRGWALQELQQVGMTLEEVFIRVVAGEESRGAQQPAAEVACAAEIWPIFKKEMRLYFTSPIAYVVGTFFLLIAGYFFYARSSTSSPAPRCRRP